MKRVLYWRQGAVGLDERKEGRPSRSGLTQPASLRSSSSYEKTPAHHPAQGIFLIVIAPKKGKEANMNRAVDYFGRSLLMFACLAVLTISGLAQSGEDGKTDRVKLEREREIGLALTAAPEHLRNEAGVYVLQRGGYVKARDSHNGFNCLVLRGGNILGPICYDAEGSETNMKADMRNRELLEQGKSRQEVEKIIDGEYRAGKLLAPRRPGIAYMLSPDFKRYDPKTGEGKQFFPPHLMFYAPYLKNSDVGSKPEHFNSHSQLFILDEGKPGAYMIVVPNVGDAHGGHKSEEKKETGSLTKEDRDFGVSYLKETRHQLHNAISGLSDAQMSFKSGPDKWSVAEITEHIINAENAVFSVVTQQVMKSPVSPELQSLIKQGVMKSPVPASDQGTDGLLVKDRAVILSATNRTTMKFQAPESVRPRGILKTKADLISQFDKTRERSIAYIETTNDDLRGHLAENWVLGVLDAYQWLLFMTAHSERHIAQINEVKAHPNFPLK